MLGLESFASFYFVPSSSEGSASKPAPPSDILRTLEQSVAEIHDSTSFRRYLDTQARFHQYSYSNVALIMAQQPDATHVAGYRAWLKLHRYVKKGERAIKIIVPMYKVNTDELGEEYQRRFFGTGHVFDISQTDGEPLPDVHVPILEGDAGGVLYGHLETLARKEEIRVQQQSALPERAMGFYEPSSKTITLQLSSQLQMTKTLAHELAHHFARHDRSDAESESVAEACAYVVCGHFGLDTGARSFPYVARWSQTTERLKTVLTTVQQVSTTMITGIEGTPTHHDDVQIHA